MSFSAELNMDKFYNRGTWSDYVDASKYQIVRMSQRIKLCGCLKVSDFVNASKYMPQQLILIGVARTLQQFVNYKIFYH